MLNSAQKILDVQKTAPRKSLNHLINAFSNKNTYYLGYLVSPYPESGHMAAIAIKCPLLLGFPLFEAFLTARSQRLTPMGGNHTNKKSPSAGDPKNDLVSGNGSDKR